MEATPKSEDEFSDSAAAALITKKINEQFKSVSIFDNKFVSEIEKAILDSGMKDSLIESYLDSVYEKTLSKDPLSIPGMFRKLAAAPDVIQNFLMHQPKVQKDQLMTCPVCGKKFEASSYSCPDCKSEVWDFGDEKKVQFLKQMHNLEPESRNALENELENVFSGFGLYDFRNPELMIEREEKTRLVYAKYGIDYQVA